MGATAGHDFVSVLSRRLGIPIINAGRRGDTTASALARLDGAVLSRSPRVVIVLLGGNDFLRRIPRETTFENLGTIVRRIREQGAAVVLVGVKVGFFSDAYGSEYERVARAMSAGVVPDILDGIFGHSGRMSDGVHPNDRGYEMMGRPLGARPPRLGPVGARHRISRGFEGRKACQERHVKPRTPQPPPDAVQLDKTL